MRRFGLTMIIWAPLFLAVPTDAGLQEFEDKAAWEAAVGDFSTVDFTGYPDNTPVTDQWSHLGITFTDFNVISGPAPVVFPEDGWGLQGFAEIQIEFANPITYIAADFPGFLAYELYSGDSFIGESETLGGSGAGFFGGVLSDEPFDRVRMTDKVFTGTVNLDNLYFAPSIPAPSVLAALGLAPLLSRRGRRRRPSS